MKKKLRDELLGDIEKVYRELLPALFPLLKITEEQSDAFIRTWRRSPFRKGLNDVLQKCPDEQFQLFQHLLARFPLEVRKHVRALQQSARTLGGRTPILPDHLRRDACEEITSLKRRGFKLQSAIADVAKHYGLTSAQLTGIWKHRKRYKT